MIPIKLERKDGLVRVVRCKDCIYRNKEDSPFCTLMKGYCDLIDRFVPDEFYCAEGREKDDAER
jgi:hypothetical protein